MCVVGSALRASNPLLFAIADVSIGIAPDARGVSGVAASSAVEPDTFLGTQMNTLHCALTLPSPGSVQTLIDLLQDCRCLVANLRQMVAFSVCAQGALALLQILAAALGMPSPLPISYILWLDLVPIPILSISLIATPAEKVRALGSVWVCLFLCMLCVLGVVVWGVGVGSVRVGVMFLGCVSARLCASFHVRVRVYVCVLARCCVVCVPRACDAVTGVGVGAARAGAHDGGTDASKAVAAR